MMAVLLAASPLAYATLLISAGLFVAALLWVIRPRGVSLLSQLAPQALALRRAQALLDSGDWQAAFAAAGTLRETKRPDRAMEKRINSFEGECLYRAAEEALQAHRYAEALELMRGAGDRLGLPEAEFDQRVLAVLLAELRRRVAVPTAGDDVAFLVQEVARVSTSCPEASFWLGLRHLFAGKTDDARTCLHEALGDVTVPDAALYLGALDRRTGRSREALRWLDHAVRQAPECPVVQWQFGAALLESTDDPTRAIRALEFATGPKGLVRHVNEPTKIWVNSLPPHSWLYKVTQRTPVSCPLGLDQPGAALTESRQLLGLALEKSGRHADAAAAYYQALSAGDDSLPVVRGLGLCLAHAGMHDEARPHLEAARAKESSPTPQTIGHLALCMSRSKPANPEDRAARITSALTVFTSLHIRGDADWLNLARELVRDAETAKVALTPAQLSELAQVFASSDAYDTQAARIYDALAGVAGTGATATPGVTLPSKAAWLYLRAVGEFDLRLPNDDALFARAFRDRDGVKRYFADHQWDFAPIERTYLDRWGEKHAGSYPDAPGSLYPAIAERVLVEESRRLDAVNRPEAARAALELALKLGPHRALTLDRLAELAYRAGDRAAAEKHLTTWMERHPNDPRPFIRRGVLARLDGRVADAVKLMVDGCEKASGAARAKYFLLTARVAIAAGKHEAGAELISRAREAGPIDAEALTALAVLWWQQGDFEKFAGLRDELESVRGDDPFRNLLTGLCHHLAGDEAKAETALAVAAADSRLAAEAAILRAVALGWQGRDGQARAVLQGIEPVGATRDLTLGLRGQFAWKTHDFVDATNAWEQIPTPRREAWKLAPLMPAAAFLTGVAALSKDQPAEALTAFRRARNLGYRDERLAALEARGVQKVVQGGPAAAGTINSDQFRALESTLFAKTVTPQAAAWLARGYRRQGQPAEARRVLELVQSDDPHVTLQRGLLFLSERQLAAAEAEFAAVVSKSPESPAGLTNLALTQLSIGRFDGLPELLDRAAERAGFVELKRTLQIFRSLLPDQPIDPGVAKLEPQDELRLLWRLQRLGRLETSAPMIGRLAEARPNSAPVAQAKGEVQVLWTQHLIDRGEWAEAMKSEAFLGMTGSRALRNLLGVAACMTRQFGKALKYFQASLPAQGDDARVQQNLALTSTWQGDLTRAAAHWKRCLNHMAAHCPAPPGDSDYLMRLTKAARRRMEADGASAPVPEGAVT